MLPLCGRDSSAPIKHAASSRSQDLVWRAPGTEGLKEDSFSVKMECFLICQGLDVGSSGRGD